MFNTNAQCYQKIADVSFHIVAYMYARFRYSGKNPMRFAVFWRISVRSCGFRTPLTPPSVTYEEPHKVPLLITLSDDCYAQFPVVILPPISCMLAGVRLAVIDSDFHRGDETILNFATVC